MYSNKSGGYDRSMMAKPVVNGQPVYGNFMYGDQQMMQPPQMMGRPNMMMMNQQQMYPSSRNSSVMIIDRQQYDYEDDDRYPHQLAGSRLPSKFYCDNCHKVETSFVEYEFGTGAWVVCLLLCCYVPPYCFIPFCLDSCKDAIHECPNCRANVGQAKFLFE